MSDDLISRQAVIDIIHLFFTEEVDKIPTKKTEDGEVYVIHKCQPLFEMNKVICKRIKALPSASPTQNCVEKCVGNALGALDCISRQAVEEIINDIRDCISVEGYCAILERMKKLPSVNPQEPMRDFTEEEAKAYSKALDKMYKPTGFNVFNEPSGDLISRQAVLDIINFEDKWLLDAKGHNADTEIAFSGMKSRIADLSSVNPQEPKTEQFAEWVASEIFDEMWEYNKDAFAEIACRKLAKLGIVRAKGDEWELVEPQEKSCNTCNNYDKRNGCAGTYDYMCECTDNDYKHWTSYQKFEPQESDIEKRKPCVNSEDGCEEWAGCPCVYYKAESEEISERNLKMWKEIFKAESEDKE